MADFVGAVNLVGARLVEVDGDKLSVDLGGQLFDLSRPGLNPDGRTEIVLSVRPETLALSSAPPADPALVPLHGQVVRHSFLGHLMRYWVRVGDHDWVVDQPDPGAAPTFEGAVYLAINPRRVHVIDQPDV